MEQSFIDVSQLEQLIKSKIESEFKTVEVKAKEKSTVDMQAAKADIFGAFVSVVNSTFIEVFTEYYGNNFETEALISSLSYFQGNNLRPDFSYDERKFRFNHGILEGVSQNNLNSKSQASFNGYRDPEAFVTGYIENFWQDDDKYFNNTDDEEDALVQQALDSLHKSEKIPASSLQFVPVNTMKRITGIVDVTEVYKMARYKALTRFNNEFVSQIKPRLVKKYRLKL